VALLAANVVYTLTLVVVALCRARKRKEIMLRSKQTSPKRYSDEVYTIVDESSEPRVVVEQIEDRAWDGSTTFTSLGIEEQVAVENYDFEILEALEEAFELHLGEN